MELQETKIIQKRSTEIIVFAFFNSSMSQSYQIPKKTAKDSEVIGTTNKNSRM